MRTRLVATVFTSLGLWAIPSTARACPDCAIGREARARVLEQHFLLGVAGVLLPLTVPVLVSALVHRRGRQRPA
jgi:hypothetical protein